MIHMMTLSFPSPEVFFYIVKEKNIHLVVQKKQWRDTLHGNNNVSYYILVSKIFHTISPSLGSAVGSASVS